ncbi:ORF6N domain-containing protein [Longicatena caecimuris]|uniref:ORF6N domain-containing protein n=1 Tax=Longicatena caecimuris TaxID=1796635 RepID=UPI003AB8C2D5
MNEVVRIKNHELQVKEYKGQRVVIFKDIDECHERPEGTAKRAFANNKERFIEGVDYFNLSKRDSLKYEKCTFEIPNRGMVVITESGYMMLVKSFTDDLAWEVQRMLVNTYFQKQPENQADLDKLMIAQAKAMNAKARVASIWLKLGDRVPNNQTYQQICNSYASEVLTGEKVLPLPECQEHYYTATEIAEMVGSNKNTVGKKAKAAGIRPVDEDTKSEYGMWFFDKSPNSHKQVSTFKYNAKGVEAVKALFMRVTA